jgi:hypothetical protein
MKSRILTAIVLMQLLTIALYAQSRTTVPRQVPFDNLSDFVNDYNKRRDGERLTIRDVPMVNKITYEKAYAMYIFKPDEDGDVGNTFYTSATLAKSLRTHFNSNTASMWVSCTLIQFVGEFDVFRSPFATKIEGLNENGEVIWTVTGSPPVKVKFRQ